MKKLAILLGCMAIMAACKKSETNTPATTTPATTGCGDGYICFKLGSNSISKTGGGYVFADTFTFVKWEEGLQQLSIDIFGNTAGSYTVGDKRLKGKGRIYYFPNTTDMYMSAKGSLELTTLGSDKKASGKFSGTLYKYNSTTETFTYTDSVVITEGFFTKVQLN